MDFYPIWPFFAGMVLVLVLVSTPVFSSTDTPSQQTSRHISVLDGLRGFLAYAVFYHHAAMSRQLLIEGSLSLPPSRFYTLIGQLGVEGFFLTTGFLFWGKLIKEQGQPDWLKLYLGRLFRVGPLYIFTVGLMLLVVAWFTGFKVQVPINDLIRQLTIWAALGALGSGPDVNGFANTPHLLFGVTWSLQIEWMFYASLLLTALVARRSQAHLPFTVAGLVASLLLVAMFHEPAPRSICALPLFFTGMLCASLLREGLIARMSNTIMSAIITLAAILIFWVSQTGYSALPIVLLGIAFFFIVCGCDIFGVLSWRGSIRLGNISYSIYLLQGLVINATIRLPGAKSFMLQSPLRFWIVFTGCNVTLLAVSAVSHRLIEANGIRLGRRVIDSLDRDRR